MSDAIAVLASIPSPLKDRMEETTELLLLSRPEVVIVAKKEKIKVDASVSRDDIVRQVIEARIKREFAALKAKAKPKKTAEKPKKRTIKFAPLHGSVSRQVIRKAVKANKPKRVYKKRKKS